MKAAKFSFRMSERGFWEKSLKKFVRLLHKDDLRWNSVSHSKDFYKIFCEFWILGQLNRQKCVVLFNADPDRQDWQPKECHFTNAPMKFRIFFVENWANWNPWKVEPSAPSWQTGVAEKSADYFTFLPQEVNFSWRSAIKFQSQAGFIPQRRENR